MITPAEKKLCEPGASAFHTNTGERWWVAGRNPDGRLIIQAQTDGREQLVTVDYWLSGSWADA